MSELWLMHYCVIVHIYIYIYKRKLVGHTYAHT
uniref:Uncharacterized protein n=1 Tax=Arundo donax TaxID=35708 RepID=A0A0A8XP21_ARUDO